MLLYSLEWLGLCILDLKESNHFLSIRNMKNRGQSYRTNILEASKYKWRCFKTLKRNLCFKRDQKMGAFKMNLFKPKLYWLWKLFLFFLLFQTCFSLPFLTLMCGSCSIRFCHKEKIEEEKPGLYLIFPVTLSISLVHTNGISHIHRNRRKRWSQRSKQNYLLINNRVGKLIAN